MLASKPPCSASLGLPASQATVSSYNPGSSHKTTHAASSNDVGPFTSPTESEFSDAHEGLEAVRLVCYLIASDLMLIVGISGRGMRRRSSNGCMVYDVASTSPYSRV